MALSFSDQAGAIAASLELTPEWTRLRAILPQIDLSADLVNAVLDQAARFAEQEIAPLNGPFDRTGCKVEQGRVVLPPGHERLWQAFGQAGWMSLDINDAYDGQGLPLTVLSAVQELFDRACVAFGMLAGGTRSAARLIQAHGDAELKAQWLPRIAAGDWSATICISEAEAGSDVGRIRTRGKRDQQGTWRVTGEKMWISFGDHQASARIGHCLLARTGDAPGTRGLSLFFVPSIVDTIDGPVRNGVVTRSVEHKMGLHASPTCALGFEDAQAILIGGEGRGLPLLFRMIIAMRLSVGVQGLGLATGAFALSRGYAAERRQGGSPTMTPSPIIEHGDVGATLADMEGRVATLRGLVHAASAVADLADHEPLESDRADAAALLQWLLPIVKTSGAETAFDVSSQAIQVMGAAGYTKDWPVEQMLRDARVLAIYEGTTGIQAQDLLKRRLMADDRGFQRFLALARSEAAEADDLAGATLAKALDRFEGVARWLKDQQRTPADLDCAATPFLRLAILIGHAWIATRLASRASRHGRLREVGLHYLRTLQPHISAQGELTLLGARRLQNA